jgi:ABC-2 type transport system permease protein
MRIAWSFLRRDLLIWTSYRLSVVWQVLGVFILMGVIYFLGTLLGENPNLIREQSGSYLAFFLSGLAFTDVFYQGMITPPQAIRENQKAGTLEPMLVTPISMISFVFSSSLFKFLTSYVRMAIYLVFGIFVLGFWREMHWATSLLVFVPACLVFLSLGTLSAAFTIVVKQGDPVLLAYGALSAVVGGTLIPIETLPEWLQPLTDLFPLTHALAGIRAGLGGATPAEAMPQILVLVLMAVVLFPVSILSFSFAVKWAKREGSLDQY